MKTLLNWATWIFAGLGVILLLLGAIAGFFLVPPYFGLINHAASIFSAATNFFLIAIFLLISLHMNEWKK